MFYRKNICTVLLRTPLGSRAKLVYEVNLMKLLYDCLDMMRVSRDDAEDLLRELTTELRKVLSGLVKPISKSMEIEIKSYVHMHIKILVQKHDLTSSIHWYVSGS